MSTALKMENSFVHHVVERHGNMTSVRDVVLTNLFLTLCSLNSFRINDYVLMTFL